MNEIILINLFYLYTIKKKDKKKFDSRKKKDENSQIKEKLIHI